MSALATFLLLYVAVLATIGFIGFVVRGTLAPGWSDRALLRSSAGLAFFLAVVLWLVIALRT